MKRLSKGVLRAALAVVVVAFGIAIYGYWWTSSPVSFGANRFNQDVWLATDGLADEWSCRWQMADDLQSYHLPEGMTREEVGDLLGTPDAKKSDELYSYNLGDWGPRSLFPVHYTLDIHFDDSGGLVSAERARRKGKAEYVVPGADEQTPLDRLKKGREETIEESMQKEANPEPEATTP